jgi:hypothetical protein
LGAPSAQATLASISSMFGRFKKDETRDASRTMARTLCVSERRSETSLPTLPDAPTTATTGCWAAGKIRHKAASTAAISDAAL